MARTMRTVAVAAAMAVAAGAFPVAQARERTTEARAIWLSRDLIAWAPPIGTSPVLLTRSGDRAVAPAVHALSPAGRVNGELARANPQLEGTPLYRIAGADRAAVRAWLKGEAHVAAMDASGKVQATTGLQIGSVVDDLYANDAPLGVGFDGRTPTIRLWAPTATSVRLHVYASARGAETASFAMVEDPTTGVWRATGTPAWNRLYYLFEVRVYAPATSRMETNVVTDPYSLALSQDSVRSQIINLDDPDLQPPGWRRFARPLPAAPEDRAIYELHVRDFSVGDASVPPAHAGKYLAFTDQASDGMRHLRALARSGLTDVHLLPTFDCATVPENPAMQRRTPDLSRFGPADKAQQAAVAAVRDADAYNWCYDPYHFLVPEGSYSTDPDGAARIVEFRRMVMGLARAGLGTILDEVYNHTMAAGQARYSVLDRIVPGYYYRLEPDGSVATSSCCANTASERAMMEKLMIDALLVWARDYRISGFRFDLMGHHSRATILKAKSRLHALTLARDGVDGAHLYLYGEGWNFGEVANDARFVQATQRHMGEGTGVGTFNDRFRDAIRGGGPSDRGEAKRAAQGFASGLFTAPNGDNRADVAQRTKSLGVMDAIRIGLAGSIADYPLVTADGRTVAARDIPYAGGALGYVSDPQETINYAEAHDNDTLFDSNAFKLPLDTSATDRVRWQNMAASLVILAQGVPFLHAGQEMLRSKSLDRNSHDSGDWFNVLDFTERTNGWGRGLPPEEDNGADWAIDRTLLSDPRLSMDRARIGLAAAHVREMLAIRRASPLFRMRTGAAIVARVHFHDTGPAQTPGLIVMGLDGAVRDQRIVVFNATREIQHIAAAIPQNYRLDPIQEASADPIVRTSLFRSGRFVVPPLTTAVFVVDQAAEAGCPLSRQAPSVARPADAGRTIRARPRSSAFLRPHRLSRWLCDRRYPP